MQAPAGLDRVFEGNRSAGRIALGAELRDGATRRTRVYEDGPLRMRFPNADGAALEAVLVNTSGGIAGGDRHELDISVGEGASLSFVSAAAEKVYRSHGPDAEVGVSLKVAEGGTLRWLPQETILFDRARLSRRIDIDLAEGAYAVIAETIVFGRSAMGEAVEQGALRDRWRVRRGGRLVFAETLRLEGAVAAKLAEPAAGNGAAAIATVLVLPGGDAEAGRVRAIGDFSGEAGISAWNGLAVARLCAKDGASLRRDLTAVLRALGVPLPRLWLQ